ncbi:hypothetical protein Tco_0185592 [Tanacetum coccineum]
MLPLLLPIKIHPPSCPSIANVPTEIRHLNSESWLDGSDGGIYSIIIFYDCMDTYQQEVMLVNALRRFRESLRRVTDGAEAFLILTLFILCLKKVTKTYKNPSQSHTYSSNLSNLHSSLQALISLTDDLSLLSNMAALESCPKHNMIAYLEKTEGNVEFHEVIDFLRRIPKTINIVRHNNCQRVARLCLSLRHPSEQKTDLIFDDADGIDTLPNQAIFNAIQLMGYEGDLNRQLANISVPLDHFPVNSLTSKVFSFMIKRGKRFSGKVTPLFDTMLVQPTQAEGASSERLSDAQPSPSPAPTSEVPNESLPDSTSAQPSEVPFEQQPEPSPSPSPRPSPQPSPTPTIPDSIQEPSGENHEDHSSNDASLSGNEDEMTLQNVYDLCISLCQQVTDQAKEIQLLKAKITKLKKQAQLSSQHFKRISEDCLIAEKNPQEELLKEAKDAQKEYNIDHMEADNAQSEGRTKEMVDEDKELDEDRLSTEDKVSTDFEKVSTDKPLVSTDGSKVSTDEQIEGADDQVEGTEENNEEKEEIFESTEDQREGTEYKVSTDEQMEGTEAQSKEENASQASQTSTLTPSSVIFGDDETIATLLINMSKAKANSKKKKEKGVELKDVEEIARIEADRILAEKLQEQEREQFTIEERAKFLHDTIAAQRKFLAQQRSEAIRNRPLTKNQLRNQMMTFLKHVEEFQTL